jgi:glycosyltransferase involved in cell wall biosynthesis
MRILYLCPDHGIPVYGRRGCSTHVRETCYALQRAGHEITLLVSQIGDDVELKRDLDILEIRPPQSRKLGYDLRNLLHNFTFYRAAKDLVNTGQIDAVYERFSLYSLVGTMLHRRFKLPRIVEVNAFLSVEHSDKLHFLRLARMAEKHIVRRAPALAVVSRPLHDSLVEMGVASERVFTMPMAVDTEHFHPDSESRKNIRSRLDLNGRYVVGYIGGLAAWHGISMLHDMAEEIRRRNADCTILVVGGTQVEVDEHRAEVARRGLGNYLIFAGSVPYSKVPGYINAMDAALVPDTNYWTCPTKMFEYQASAVPTIAPEYPAILESIQHGREGLLFKPRDLSQAVNCILKLGGDPEARRAMGENARQRVAATHSWQHNVESITSLYEAMRSGDFPLSGPLAHRPETTKAWEGDPS